MKNWEKTGEFGPEGNHVKGVWECPDLFPIEYKGKKCMGSRCQHDESFRR